MDIGIVITEELPSIFGSEGIKFVSDRAFATAQEAEDEIKTNPELNYSDYISGRYKLMYHTKCTCGAEYLLSLDAPSNNGLGLCYPCSACGSSFDVL